MNFEEILIKNLNRAASQFKVPPNFRRELEEALLEVENRALERVSIETIENLKREALLIFNPAWQPVF
ncbi:MAG: hypothetical protein NUV68_00795 [Caldiserica bacterium]|jgi:hypothetical protein|nr:hypothetical protein [Caldisericota bacterium]MDH7561897.1 hypothetical protein [Caldisericota bacterium]